MDNNPNAPQHDCGETEVACNETHTEILAALHHVVYCFIRSTLVEMAGALVDYDDPVLDSDGLVQELVDPFWKEHR